MITLSNISIELTGLEVQSHDPSPNWTQTIQDKDYLRTTQMLSINAAVTRYGCDNNEPAVLHQVVDL